VKLSWDDTDGEHEEDATARLLSERLKALDGDERTYVSVGDASTHLMCGGDAGSGVVLYVQLGDRNEQLVSGDAEETKEVVAAGQPGDYPGRFVVGLDLAQQAASYFLEHRGTDDGLTWEEQ
jgi:Immunity protein Imm1